MVEYETIALVFGIVGILSYQNKLIHDRLKEEIKNAKEIHGQLCGKITNLQGKLDKISKHLGVF
jgi:hypothetical protein